MSILNVDKIQPIGGGSTITVDATDIQASTGTIRASTFSGDVSATGIGVTSLNVTGVSTITGNAYFGSDIYLTDDSGGYEKVEVNINDVRFEHKHLHSEFGVWTRSTSVTDRKNGIESGGTDLRLYSNSTEKVRIDSSGNVNIGANASSNPFTYLRFGASLYGAADIRPTDEASHKVGLAFYTDGTQDTTINPTEKVRITSSGRVGINETSPDTDLHIKNTNPAIYLEGTNGSGRQHKIWTAGLNSESLQFTSGNLLYNADVHYFRASNESTEYLRINSSGQIGIGTATPESLPLTVAASTAAIALVDTDRTNSNYYSAVWGDQVGNLHLVADYEGAAGSQFISARVGGTALSNEKLRITSGGDFVVGSTALGNAGSFGVQSSGAFRSILAASNASDTLLGAISGVSNGFQINIDSSNNQEYRFHNGSQQNLTLNSSGKLLVGVTSGSNHHISSGASTLNTVFQANLGGAGATCAIRVKMNTSANDGLQIQQNGSGTLVAGGAHCTSIFNREDGPMRFGTDNTERLRISSDGYITAPNNVAFSARGGPADVTNNVIIFATQVFQRGGTNYDTSTGYFTAPVAGIYHFMCNPYRYTDSNDSAILLETSTDGGSNWSAQMEIRNMNNYSSDSGRGWFTLSLSQLIDLNKDDKVRIKAVNRVHTNGVYSRFSGFLVA